MASPNAGFPGEAPGVGLTDKPLVLRGIPVSFVGLVAVPGVVAPEGVPIPGVIPNFWPGGMTMVGFVLGRTPAAGLGVPATGVPTGLVMNGLIRGFPAELVMNGFTMGFDGCVGFVFGMTPAAGLGVGFGVAPRGFPTRVANGNGFAVGLTRPGLTGLMFGFEPAIGMLRVGVNEGDRGFVAGFGVAGGTTGPAAGTAGFVAIGFWPPVPGVPVGVTPVAFCLWFLKARAQVRQKCLPWTVNWTPF